MTQQRRTSFINFRTESGSSAMAWEDICGDASWQGRWIALDASRHEYRAFTRPGWTARLQRLLRRVLGRATR